MPTDLNTIYAEILLYATKLQNSVIHATGPSILPYVGWRVANADEWREWAFTPERIQYLKSITPGLQNTPQDLTTHEGLANLARAMQVVLHEVEKAQPQEQRESIWQLLLKG